MKLKIVCLLIIFSLCVNNIVSFQLNLVRKSKSKSRRARAKAKALAKEVDFTNEVNLLNMLGGLISYFFGFYQQYKTVQAHLFCLTDNWAKIKTAVTEAFRSVSTKLGTVIEKCQNSNPVQFIWNAATDLFSLKTVFAGATGSQAGDTIDKLAADLFKKGDCYTAAEVLYKEILKVIETAKTLIDDVKKCIEDFMKNKSKKPDYITQAVIDAAVAVGSKLINFATGGAIDASQAILIAIKFGLVCSYTDAEFLPIHKYRVLGKYLAKLLKLALGIPDTRRAKYRYYKRMMMKYKKYKN
jgi:hypothetical protein